MQEGIVTGFQLGFGYEENRSSRLSIIGDPLEKLADAVNFEMFRPLLNEVFVKPNRKHDNGRPALDCVLIFRILILRQLYNISDDKTEYLINDRLSFQRFLGLRLGSAVPDAKTIWNYRSKLAESGKSILLFGFFAVAQRRLHRIQ